MKLDLIIGLTALFVMWAFLFWCVFWACTSNMGSVAKCLVVILCVFAFFSIRFKHIDDGKHSITIGSKDRKEAANEANCKD